MISLQNLPPWPPFLNLKWSPFLIFQYFCLLSPIPHWSVLEQQCDLVCGKKLWLCYSDPNYIHYASNSEIPPCSPRHQPWETPMLLDPLVYHCGPWPLQYTTVLLCLRTGKWSLITGSGFQTRPSCVESTRVFWFRAGPHFAAGSQCNGHVRFVKHLYYIPRIIGTYVFNVQRYKNISISQWSRNSEHLVITITNPNVLLEPEPSVLQ